MLINSKKTVKGYQRNEILYDPNDIRYKVREIKERAQRMQEIMKRQAEAQRFNKSEGSKLAKEVKDKVKALNFKLKDMANKR